MERKITLSIILLGIVTVCWTVLAGSGHPRRLLLEDIWDPGKPARWTETTKIGMGGARPEFIQSTEYGRTPVATLCGIAGANWDITHTNRGASELNRMQLEYVDEHGQAVVVDNASEANGRILATDTSVTLTGFLPANYTKTYLYRWSDDGKRILICSTDRAAVPGSRTQASPDDWRQRVPAFLRRAISILGGS